LSKIRTFLPQLKERFIRKPIPGSGLILQLFVFVFLPLTALLLIVAFGSLNLHQSAMRNLVTARDERAVRTAASALRAQLEHRLLELDGLSDRAASVHDDGLEEVLINSQYLLASFPGGLGFFEQEGSALATTQEAYIIELLSITASNLLPQGIQSGQTVLVPTYSLPGDGKLAYLAVASEAGRVVVGIFFPGDLAKNILEEAFPQEEHASIFIMDHSQNLLYSRGEHAKGNELAGHAGVLSAFEGLSGATYMQIEGQEQIVAYSPVEPAGWALVVQEPAAMVETLLLSSTLLAPLVLVPALLIAMLALFFGARQVVRPLQALEEQAARLAWGDFEAVREPVGGIAEIRSLQAGLVHLADKVKDAQQSLHSYIGAITAGQEEERRRLSRELHDDTLQGMIALKQRVQLLKISEGDQPASQSLGEIEALTEQTIQELRRLTRALRPIYLEDLGLPAALEMLVQETGQALGLLVTFNKTGRERRQSPDKELALYRITQEALSNASWHAGAKYVAVTIQYSFEALILEIADDGVGFQVPKSPAEFAPSGHFGLLGMHERAELIGAKLSINSSPEEGTRITVTLPDQEEIT
jgi:signal transduction histidine kinase